MPFNLWNALNDSSFVVRDRVEGDLALSRALGDFRFKRLDLPAVEQAVTPSADMTTFRRHKHDQFLLLCCDGVWDVTR